MNNASENSYQKVWHILVQWTNGSISQVPLCQLKEAKPIKVAKYVQTHNLPNEPAFVY